MPTPTPLSKVQLQHNHIGDLDTFNIHGQGFHAVVLKQGAQLIQFLTGTDESDNWLWVSDKAQYNRGESVRGGVPICWPVFGQFAANPQVVKDSFSEVANITNMPQHGFARTQLFELDSFSVEDNDEEAQTATLILTLDNDKIADKSASAPNLVLKVVFTFSANGFGIKLITQNNSDKTITFSQALHTYLPTDNIEQTTITGFDSMQYSDTIDEWNTKTQQGDITFTSEVDRIYHGAPDIRLITPAHTYQLYAQGSNSTVIWNPWIEKSKLISQFSEDDYQHMLCIETANAHLDVVELGVGESYKMRVSVTKKLNSL